MLSPHSLFDPVCHQPTVSACAFVQHSATAQDGDMEGTPVAVLEAQPATLPVVATRHAGIPDVVVDGETGWLVDEHDIDGMAERMCRLLARPEETRGMGEAGRRRIREHFTMQRSIERLDRCISDSLRAAYSPGNSHS